MKTKLIPFTHKRKEAVQTYNYFGLIGYANVSVFVQLKDLHIAYEAFQNWLNTFSPSLFWLKAVFKLGVWFNQFNMNAKVCVDLLKALCFCS